MLTPEQLLELIKEATKYLGWNGTRNDYVFNLDDLVNDCYIRLSYLVDTPVDDNIKSTINKVVKDSSIRQYKHKLPVISDFGIDPVYTSEEPDETLENLTNKLATLLVDMHCNELIEPLLPQIRNL